MVCYHDVAVTYDMYKYYIFLFAFLFLSSCIEDLAPNLGENPKQVAVYCIFAKNEPWKLVLQQTQLVGIADSSSITPIKNALVEIRGDDGSYRKLEYLGGGMYWLDTDLPQEHVVYTLTVQGAGQKTLKATDRIPKPFQPEKYEQKAIPNENNRFQTDWYFKGRQEVQYFTGLFVSNIELQSQIKEQEPYSPFSVDNIIEGEGYFETTPFGNKDFVLKSETRDIVRYGERITAINQHLFQYYRAIIKQQFTEGNYFAEPTNSTTNIENGIGIFGGEYHTDIGNYYDFNPVGYYELLQYTSINKGVNVDHIQNGVKCEIEILTNGTLKGSYQLGFDKPTVHFKGGWIRGSVQTDKVFSVKLYTDVNIAILQAGFPDGGIANGRVGLQYNFRKS